MDKTLPAAKATLSCGTTSSVKECIVREKSTSVVENIRSTTSSRCFKIMRTRVYVKSSFVCTYTDSQSNRIERLLQGRLSTDLFALRQTYARGPLIPVYLTLYYEKDKVLTICLK